MFGARLGYRGSVDNQYNIRLSESSLLKVLQHKTYFSPSIVPRRRSHLHCEFQVYGIMVLTHHFNNYFEIFGLPAWELLASLTTELLQNIFLAGLGFSFFYLFFCGFFSSHTFLHASAHLFVLQSTSVQPKNPPLFYRPPHST
jgi:hypothetical protein